jgi:hypothetical protein
MSVGLSSRAARNKAHFLCRLSIHTHSIMYFSSRSMTIQGFLLCKRLFIIEFDGISYWKYARGWPKYSTHAGPVYVGESV